MLHRAALSARDRLLAPYESEMYEDIRQIQSSSIRHFQGKVMSSAKEYAGGLNLDDDDENLDYLYAQYERAVPTIERTFRFGGRSGVAKARGTVSFLVNNPAAEAFLRRQSQRFVRQVAETAWTELKTSLADALERGAGVDELTAIVAQNPAFSAQRARMIARTETGAAYNAGLEQGFIQSGNVVSKVWLSAIDDRTRDTHREMHNQMVPVKENFVSPSGAEGPSPGQMGTAEEDINCRCTLEGIIGILDDEVEEDADN